MKYLKEVSIIIKLIAEIAQSVEHFTRNEGVVGSSPIFSFRLLIAAEFGSVAIITSEG